MAVVDDPVARHIYEVLKKGYLSGPEDFIDVSRGYDDFLHVVIVSRKFDQNKQEKEDLIWSDLINNLTPDEWGRVSLTIGVSPEEIKAMV